MITGKLGWAYQHKARAYNPKTLIKGSEYQYQGRCFGRAKDGSTIEKRNKRWHPVDQATLMALVSGVAAI